MKRINNSKFPNVGVAVVVVRGGKVLLGKRKGSHGADRWGFPGGHLEFGESLEDCAKREVKEETNLDVDNLVRIGFTNDFFQKEDKHYVTLFMLARKVIGNQKLMEPSKCDGWEWFSWRKLSINLFLPIQNLLKQGFDLDKYLENMK